MDIKGEVMGMSEIIREAAQKIKPRHKYFFGFPQDADDETRIEALEGYTKEITRIMGIIEAVVECYTGKGK